MVLSAIAKFALGFACVSALLFLPAGTMHYPNAWLLLAILFIPMFLAGLVLLAANPDLLRSRLQAREIYAEQKQVVGLSGLMFLCGFLAAGLDFRFGWSALPHWLPRCAAVLFLLAYALYAEVLRENAWLSRTVQVQEGQTVVDTGLYAIVRHPMYCATVLLFLAMPLVLGSLVSFLIFMSYPFLIVKRIRNEEQVLDAQLQGYTEYKRRVRYRLIPYLW